MTTTTPTPAWRDRVDSVQPTVLFLGGFMSSPPIYRELRDLLLARGAPDVIVAPIWTMDWLLSIKRGQAADKPAAQVSKLDQLREARSKRA